MSLAGILILTIALTPTLPITFILVRPEARSAPNAPTEPSENSFSKCLVTFVIVIALTLIALLTIALTLALLLADILARRLQSEPNTPEEPAQRLEQQELRSYSYGFFVFKIC